MVMSAQVAGVEDVRYVRVRVGREVTKGDVSISSLLNTILHKDKIDRQIL